MILHESTISTIYVTQKRDLKLSVKVIATTITTTKNSNNNANTNTKKIIILEVRIQN